MKVFGLDVDLGTESGTDKGAITGKVRLRYDAGGGSWQGGPPFAYDGYKFF